MEEPNKKSRGDNRRFENAGDAAKELFDGFNDWSAAVNVYGVQTAYAVIAANWAVYGNAQTILNNPWAKVSIAIVVGFLGINLLCIGLMTRLYSRRRCYADKDKERWKVEFEKEVETSSPWPYTGFIEVLGSFIRIFNMWAPVMGGAIFIIGLFITNNHV